MKGDVSTHRGFTTLRRIRTALLLAVLSVSIAGPAAAQLTSGTIQGTVTDQTGAVLPGVDVTVQNVNTGLSRTLVTSEVGRYEAPNLQVGSYEVTANLAGFTPVSRKGITLTVGRTAVIDLSLSVGASEEIVVTGEAPLLETTSATVSNLVDSKRVEDLPLVNRDLTQLTFLQPGVVKIPSSGDQGVFSGMGDKFTVAGARGTQNLYLLDGVSNADLSGNAQGASGSYAGAETVQEIQIVTNNYSAEYRSAAGGIVSAVTKSGTNTLHGSAYLFHRDDALENRDYFQEQLDIGKPNFTRNQWGGSLGGPIVRNKLFFFGSYEGLKEETGETDFVRTLSDNARRGIFPDGTVIAIDPRIVPYLPLWPVPGDGNTLVQEFSDGSAQIAKNGVSTVDDNFVLVKGDYQINGSNNLSVTYNWNKGDRARFGILKEISSNVFATESEKNILGIKHTAVLGSSALNELHFGYSVTAPSGDIPQTDRDFGSLVFRPNRTLVGQFQVGGLTSLGYRTDRSDYQSTSYTFKDGFSLARGNHSLRTGGEVTYYKYDVFSCSRGCNGMWQFADIPRLLQARPRDFQAMLPGGDNPTRDLRQFALGAYFQDNWRVSNTFTLNVGLRYEFASVPKEQNGLSGALVDVNDADVTLGPFFINPTKKSFSPRVGFAWAPGSDNKWAVRGGFGVFYEHPMLYNIRTTLQELPPFTLVGRLRDRNAPGRIIDFPNAFFTQQALLATTPNIRTMQYDLDQTTIYRWSVTMQRDIGRGFVASADYTGSRGYNLWQQALPNINRWQGWPETVPSLEKFWPGGTGPIFPQWGEMRIQHSNAGVWYKGVSFGLQKRLEKGFSMQMAFTLSKTVDQGSGVTSGGDELPQSQRGIYAWDLDLKKGLSAYDVRKAFSTNLSYELPLGAESTGVAGAFAKGWQVNAIITLTDGYAVSVYDESDTQNRRIGDNEGLFANLVPGGDPNPVLGGPDRYFDTSQFEPSTLGYFGNSARGTLTTPGLAKVDLSVFKTFTFATSQRLQFRFEVFNLLNRANFATPEMTLVLPNGSINEEAGQITRVRTPARQIQLGLRWVF